MLQVLNPTIGKCFHERFGEACIFLGIDLQKIDQTVIGRLVSLNIFVWNEANGPVRIHGGDYSITIVIKERQRRYVVEATKPWEKVRSMIEADLRLSSGLYLDLEIRPSGTTADENAFDEDDSDEE
ncbi:hypothetical protein Tco_0090653 [Tanacetum coccineum]